MQSETVRDQVTRLVRVQRDWADNAVSATISFQEHEKQQLADLLETYAADIKSISCLPRKHGYAQPPYEQIGEDEYEGMSAVIDHDSPLAVGGDFELTECDGGACPIR